jgi:hypothetical protein
MQQSWLSESNMPHHQPQEYAGICPPAPGAGGFPARPRSRSPDETRQLIQDSARLLQLGDTLYLGTIKGDPGQSGKLTSIGGARRFQYYHAEATLMHDLAYAGFAEVKVMRIGA